MTFTEVENSIFLPGKNRILLNGCCRYVNVPTMYQCQQFNGTLKRESSAAFI